MRLAGGGPNLIGHLEARGVKAKRISEWASTGDPTAPEALVAHFDTQDTDLIVAGASDLRGVTKVCSPGRRSILCIGNRRR